MRQTFQIYIAWIAALSPWAPAPAATGRHHTTTANAVLHPTLQIDDTITPTPLIDLAKSPELPIVGTVLSGNATSVRLRLTAADGQSHVASAKVIDGRFRCVYPNAFPGAIALSPQTVFIDATTDGDFDVSREGHEQVEITVMLYDSRSHGVAQLPNWFTDGLIDAAGRVDANAAQWPAARAIANLYVNSEAAHLISEDHGKFDLARPGDLDWFKREISLYDFEHRDREWSTPLQNHVARTFWLASARNWFGPSNDLPLDGNPQNRRNENYDPYAFCNDVADLLVLYSRFLTISGSNDKLLETICRDSVANLLAMQSTDAKNFSIPDRSQRQFNYTAGAFHYGTFADGAFMTESNGWFATTPAGDQIRGGVFNGRAVWGLGESLRTDHKSPHADAVRRAIALAVKFCLYDALPRGYAVRTSQGNVLWRDAGEQGYMLDGLLAACLVEPNLQVQRPGANGAVPLKEVCAQCLDAICDVVAPSGHWMVYPDVDAVAIAALARGVQVLPHDPHADRWQRTAVHAADLWLNARPDDYPAPLVHFGALWQPEKMTFRWPLTERKTNSIYFFQSGHWLRALSQLQALTNDHRYQDRAQLIMRYLCGVNPWHIRLLTETGGIYNSVSDQDGDGIEDTLRLDLYPESTAFCGIGIIDWMRHLAGLDND